jgi:membrane-associated phospholipid phosphatase
MKPVMYTSGMKPWIRRFDGYMTISVQAIFPQKLKWLFTLFSWAGEPLVTLIVSLALMDYGQLNDAPWAIITGMSVPATLILGFLLKLAFERTRPLTDYVRHMLIRTFSFPSGHASSSVVLYGLLAYQIFRSQPSVPLLGVAFVFVILPVFIGIARVYLGAHYPSDVVAGWLLGLAIVFAIALLAYPLVEK